MLDVLNLVSTAEAGIPNVILFPAGFLYGNQRRLLRRGDGTGAQESVGGWYPDRFGAGTRRPDYWARPQLPGADRQRDRSWRNELFEERRQVGGECISKQHHLFDAFAVSDVQRGDCAV